MTSNVETALNVLDLAILAQTKQIEELSELVGELKLAVQELQDAIDNVKKRTEVMKRYYEPIEG